jgi:hypothetical protein
MSIKTKKEYIEQFKSIIQSSNLNESKKNLWFNFIDKAPSINLEPVYKILNKDIAQLSFLTKNLEDKIKAIKNKDINLWNKILEEEADHLLK